MVFRKFIHMVYRFIPGFLFVFFSTGLYGQNGFIEGVVSDKKTGETLVGANIIISGTTTGTITNFNGEYRLAVPVGTQDIQVSFISYEPVVYENVKVGRGQTVTLNTALDEATVVLEGVEVTARRITHTEIAVISTIRNAQVVASGISSQQISRSQDSDAAEVVRRIPGVIVVNDRFIVVRGLSERYNNVLLHNLPAPSLEPDIRSFSFDIIPSSQIERIMIYKSPAADLPGEFAGGLVKIETKSIPDKTGFEISYSNGFKPGTTFRPFETQEKGPLAWTAFNEGYFDLPAGFPDDLRTITTQPDRLQEAGRSLKNNWVPVEKMAWLDQSLSLTANLKFTLKGIEIGNITSINYGNSYNTNEVTRFDYNAYDLVAGKSLPIYDFTDEQFNNNMKLGILHNWGIRFNRNHSVEIMNLFNQTASYRYINRTGPHMDFGFLFNNHAFQQIYRGLYTGGISGKHQFRENTRLDWTAGMGKSYRDMPDYKQYRSERPLTDVDGEYYNIYVPIGGAQPYFLGRFHSDMEEASLSYAANLARTIVFREDSWFKPVVKTGILYETKEREFRARNIGYTQAPGFDMFLREVPVDSLFHPENINNYGGIKIDEQSNPQDSYDAANELHAGYLMIEIPFTEKFKVIAGIRVENNHRRLNSATTSGEVKVNRKDQALLPSVNMAYSFTEKSLLRFAYGKTLNRPEFRENAPFGFFDFDDNHVVTGFQFLEPAGVNNFDLRFEHYPSPSEVMSLGVFYKHFNNAIERVFLPGSGSGGSKNFSFGNSEMAEVYGIEVDVRKSLAGWLPGRMGNNLVLVFNGALMKSNVTIGAGSRSQGRDTDPRPLQGQSPYIINMSLYYNNLPADLQANISWNLIGPRIYSAGFTELDQTTISYPDIYEMPRHLIDITLSKRISKHISLKAGISDLLNQAVIFLQDANLDGKFDRYNDQMIQSFKPDASLSAGLSFKW